MVCCESKEATDARPIVFDKSAGAAVDALGASEVSFLIAATGGLLTEGYFAIADTATAAFPTVLAALPNLPFYFPLAAFAAAALAFFFLSFLRWPFQRY